MTTLAIVYTTKNDRETIDKVIALLEQNGIEAFTTGVSLTSQLLHDMTVCVRSHQHDQAEILCYDIFFPEG